MPKGGTMAKTKKEIREHYHRVLRRYREQYIKWRTVMLFLVGEKVFKEIDERTINDSGSGTFVDFCLEWAQENKKKWSKIIKDAKKKGPGVSPEELEKAAKWMRKRRKKTNNLS